MNVLQEIKPIKQEYRCKWCGAIVARHSEKHWINSWCDKKNKKARLILVKIK